MVAPNAASNSRWIRYTFNIGKEGIGKSVEGLSRNLLVSAVPEFDWQPYTTNKFDQNSGSLVPLYETATVWARSHILSEQLLQLTVLLVQTEYTYWRFNIW